MVNVLKIQTMVEEEERLRRLIVPKGDTGYSRIDTSPSNSNPNTESGMRA